MLTVTLISSLLSSSPAFTEVSTPEWKAPVSEEFLSADGHRVVVSDGTVREVNDSSGNTRRYYLDGRIEAIDNDGQVWKL